MALARRNPNMPTGRQAIPREMTAAQAPGFEPDPTGTAPPPQIESRERTTGAQMAGPSAVPREAPTEIPPEIELARIQATLSSLGVPVSSVGSALPPGIAGGPAPSHLATPPRGMEPSPLSAQGTDGAMQPGSTRSLAPITPSGMSGQLGGFGSGQVGGGLMAGSSARGEARPTGLMQMLMQLLNQQGSGGGSPRY